MVYNWTPPIITQLRKRHLLKKKQLVKICRIFGWRDGTQAIISARPLQTRVIIGVSIRVWTRPFEWRTRRSAILFLNGRGGWLTCWVIISSLFHPLDLLTLITLSRELCLMFTFAVVFRSPLAHCCAPWNVSVVLIRNLVACELWHWQAGWFITLL
uniref:Uncharacterized protein n=1 Tax=Triticum urartu TaxID=4572 RepID=A0A8R7UTW5_TRIUA